MLANPWDVRHLQKLGQGLGVSVQNLFRSFGIFSEIVRVTLFWGHTVYNLGGSMEAFLHGGRNLPPWYKPWMKALQHKATN